MGKGDAPPAALLIAGPPASGKSTVAASLARTLGATLIDQDIATGPLLSVIGSLINIDDIDDPRLATLTRADRYETITWLAEDNLRVGNTVVVVAPFTAERTNLRAWEDLSHRLQRATEGAVTMVWLYLSREELLQRMRARQHTELGGLAGRIGRLVELREEQLSTADAVAVFLRSLGRES